MSAYAKLIVAAVSDALSFCQYPGGSALSAAFDIIQKRRSEDATKIVLEQFRKGEMDFLPEDTEPLCEILFLYGRATEEGTARRNLKLLAMVIVGLKKNKALAVDRFQRWLPALSQLTRDEILLLGFAYDTVVEIDNAVEPPQQYVPSFANRLHARMKAAGYSQDETAALCACVSRYGFLIPKTAMGLQYGPTSYLRQLGELTAFNQDDWAQ